MFQWCVAPLKIDVRKSSLRSVVCEGLFLFLFCFFVLLWMCVVCGALLAVSLIFLDFGTLFL